MEGDHSDFGNQTINRSVVIVKPRRLFIAWANALPDADREYSDEVFETDCTAFLIPEFDTQPQSEQYLYSVWQDIFEHELHGWCTEEMWWPSDRSLPMFKKWFTIEIHSSVVDLGTGSIIREL